MDMQDSETFQNLIFMPVHVNENRFILDKNKLRGIQFSVLNPR